MAYQENAFRDCVSSFLHRTRFLSTNIIIRLVSTEEANKDDILLGLRHIHAFKVERAKISWRIRKKDLSTALEQESPVKCVALLPTDEQHLNIWLTTQDTAAEIDRLRAIAVELADFCRITNEEQIGLLVKALTEQNRKHIEDEFRAVGIPVEPNGSTHDSEMGKCMFRFFGKKVF